MSENNILKVEVCLGSSCYSKGSNKIVEEIENYMSENANTNVKVDLRGCLCLDRCMEGPIVRVNGKEHTKVSHATIIDILRDYIR